MKVKIELTTEDLKELVLNHLIDVLPADADPKAVRIEVKSKQNYKSEWESGEFRAVYEKNEL